MLNEHRFSSRLEALVFSRPATHSHWLDQRTITSAYEFGAVIVGGFGTDSTYGRRLRRISKRTDQGRAARGDESHLNE